MQYGYVAVYVGECMGGDWSWGPARPCPCGLSLYRLVQMPAAQPFTVLCCLFAPESDGCSMEVEQLICLRVLLQSGRGPAMTMIL